MLKDSIQGNFVPSLDWKRLKDSLNLVIKKFDFYVPGTPVVCTNINLKIDYT